MKTLLELCLITVYYFKGYTLTDADDKLYHYSTSFVKNDTSPIMLCDNAMKMMERIIMADSIRLRSRINIAIKKYIEKPEILNSIMLFRYGENNLMLHHTINSDKKSIWYRCHVTNVCDNCNTYNPVTQVIHNNEDGTMDISHIRTLCTYCKRKKSSFLC